VFDHCDYLSYGIQGLNVYLREAVSGVPETVIRGPYGVIQPVAPGVFLRSSPRLRNLPPYSVQFSGQFWLKGSYADVHRVLDGVEAGGKVQRVDWAWDWEVGDREEPDPESCGLRGEVAHFYQGEVYTGWKVWGSYFDVRFYRKDLESPDLGLVKPVWRFEVQFHSKYLSEYLGLSDSIELSSMQSKAKSASFLGESCDFPLYRGKKKYATLKGRLQYWKDRMNRAKKEVASVRKQLGVDYSVEDFLVDP